MTRHAYHLNKKVLKGHTPISKTPDTNKQIVETRGNVSRKDKGTYKLVVEVPWAYTTIL